MGARGWLPPKRFFDDLNAANPPESVRVDRTDRLSCLFTKPHGTADANEKTRELVGSAMLPSRRGEQFACMIDCGVDHGSDPRPSRGDGELGRQVGINLLDVEGRGTRVVNRDLEVKRDDLLKESREGGNHGLK